MPLAESAKLILTLQYNAAQASFSSDWAIFHSTVESSVSNEVKDFPPALYFPATAGKCYKSH